MYSSFAEDIKARSKSVAVEIILELNNVKYTSVNSVLIKQLTRSATSIGANYRAALKAKSKADFLSKLSTCIEECDESLYWIELMVETKMVEQEAVQKSYNEVKELLLILSKTKSSTKENMKKQNELHEPIETYYTTAHLS